MNNYPKRYKGYKDETIPYGSAGAAPGGAVAINPSFTGPSLTLTRTPSESILLTQQGLAVDISPSFNKGEIYFPSGTLQIDKVVQNPRSGDLTGYTVDGVSVTEPISITKDINIGNNTISLVASYAEGAQPLDSLGNAFDSPLPVGTITKDIIIEGALPMLSVESDSAGNTMNNPLESVGLYSSGVAEFNVLLAAESEDFQAGIEYKWRFLIPKYIHDTLVSVEFWQFDNFQSQDYTIHLTGFTNIGIVSQTVNGVTYDYIEYVNQSFTLTAAPLDALIKFIR